LDELRTHVGVRQQLWRGRTERSRTSIFKVNLSEISSQLLYSLARVDAKGLTLVCVEVFRRGSAHLLQVAPSKGGDAGQAEVGQAVEALEEKVDGRDGDVFTIGEMDAFERSALDEGDDGFVGEIVHLTRHERVSSLAHSSSAWREREKRTLTSPMRLSLGRLVESSETLRSVNCGQPCRRAKNVRKRLGGKSKKGLHTG
jgi:hypothetical protein